MGFNFFVTHRVRSWLYHGRIGTSPSLTLSFGLSIIAINVLTRSLFACPFPFVAQQVKRVVRNDNPEQSSAIGEVPFFFGVVHHFHVRAHMDGDVQLLVLSKVTQ